MSGRETKRRWALHHVNAFDGWAPWPAFTFTARGREKAARKLMRRLDRRPGVALFMVEHPEHFQLRPVQ